MKHEPEPIDRHRRADIGQAHRGEIHDAVLAKGSDHAERHADQQRDSVRPDTLSCMVEAKRSTISSVTGTRNRIDVPRSPISALATNRRY